MSLSTIDLEDLEERKLRLFHSPSNSRWSKSHSRDSFAWEEIIRKSGLSLSQAEKIPPRNLITNVLGKIGRNLVPDVLADPSSETEKSRPFQINGLEDPNLHIGFINGMQTSFEQSQEYASYISKIAFHHTIYGIYNQEHSLPLSVLEVGLNILGYSPNTDELLRKNWGDFHELHKENPKAKILHFCHSQGTFHTRNALEHSPKEIRDRLIVVAIAPGTIVPEELCYRSYNFVSANDIAHLPDLVVRSLISSPENRLQLLREREQLMLLRPHPNAMGLDHAFNSPTFLEPIQSIVKDYFDHNGQYEVARQKIFHRF